MTARCPGPLEWTWATDDDGFIVAGLIDCHGPDCDYAVVVPSTHPSAAHDEAHASTPWMHAAPAGGAS